ncbi:hypothetical protein HaLaN_30680 [Haematococcus lacustris]|uniref:Uncharacterized protein n=1 Tax=Haematococcus lacustris TaxID=44745 RepID=A0A6A0AG22_HAELA|nr:hypothetical protein HaLaN_30680 [Haematococcus lacustris]
MCDPLRQQLSRSARDGVELYLRMCDRLLPHSSKPLFSPDQLMGLPMVCELRGEAHAYLVALVLAASAWEHHGLHEDSMDPVAWRKLRHLVFEQDASIALTECRRSGALREWLQSVAGEAVQIILFLQAPREAVSRRAHGAIKDTVSGKTRQWLAEAKRCGARLEEAAILQALALQEVQQQVMDDVAAASAQDSASTPTPPLLASLAAFADQSSALGCSLEAVLLLQQLLDPAADPQELNRQEG